MKAIQEAPAPKNCMCRVKVISVHNYCTIVVSYHLLTALLYALLKRRSCRCWKFTQDEAFQAAKQAFQADLLLINYHFLKPLLLACDASPSRYCFIIMEDLQECPLAYV